MVAPRPDGLAVRDAAEREHGIELKTGGASKAAFQDFPGHFLNLVGGDGTGRLKGVTIESATTVCLP
jgi:filamentous hemagglutinin